MPDADDGFRGRRSTFCFMGRKHAPQHITAATPVSGFTLTETLITIGLVAVMLAVYSMTLSGTVFLRRSQYNTLAANFIQEELDTLRSLPYIELLDRANGNFLGLALQRGNWKVKNVTGDGQNKRLVLDAPAAALIEGTGLAILPGNYRDNFTLAARIKVDSSSPAGWSAGLALRYRDAENHYRFRFSAGGNALDKVFHGVRTTVWSDNNTCTTGAGGTCWNWQTLEVVANGTAFTLKRNGITLTTVNDAGFLAGDTAVISINGAKMSADDVAVTAVSTTTWNFETYAENSYPLDWQRMSYVDLPGGSGTLTIANYLSEPNMKEATVTVSWRDGGSTRSASASTVIGK